ncbi:MAG: methyltransferase domain-containing protein [Bdellovibrionales bacterium]
MLETLNTILFWLFLWILLWQGYILIFNRGVPNIKTAKAIRKKIIEMVKKDCERRNIDKPVIYDLGAGNGDFSRDIARCIPNASVIGVEISKLSIAKAKLFTKLAGIKNLTYRRDDIFQTDLSDADAIVFFLSAYEMGRMSEMLKTQNLKPDTMIISNRFALHDWPPAQTLSVKTPIPKQGTVYVYKTSFKAIKHP